MWEPGLIDPCMLCRDCISGFQFMFLISCWIHCSLIVKFNLQVDDEIAKLKALKAELGSSGQNWAMDKKPSGSKEGPKPSPASQAAPPVQDPRVKEQGDLVRRLKSAKVSFIQSLLAFSNMEQSVGEDF